MLSIASVTAIRKDGYANLPLVMQVDVRVSESKRHHYRTLDAVDDTTPALDHNKEDTITPIVQGP